MIGLGLSNMPPKVTIADDIDPLSSRSLGEDGAMRSQSQPPSSESSGGGEEIIDDNDMLSGLPDHILICILSFLPTKHVRRTSMLSRRWRRLYKHVPVLDLAESDFHCRPEDLCAFLSAARCIQGPWRSLKIRAGIDSCWCWINRLRFNKNFDLEKLHVIDGTRPDRTSLSKFLAIKSLKELHLDLHGRFTWPSDSRMPSLQKLHLQSIILDVDDASANSVTSINIFFCFPALENCTMYDCRLPGALVVSGPQLKRFSLTYCRANRILVVGDSLVDFSINRCTFEAKEPLRVEISAPNIQYFTWECTELGHSNISTFNSLVSASIDVHPGDDQLVRKDMKLLISAVPKARRLRLGRGAFEVLRQSHSKSFESNTAENINLNNIIKLNTFNNLLILELWLRNFKINYVAIFYLLKYCPKLKTIIIHNEQIKCFSQDEDEYIFEPKYLLLEELETAHIHEFTGSELEMSFVRSLLRVSKKLTKIIIFPSSHFFSQEHYKRHRWRKLSLMYQLGKEAVFDVVFPDSSSLSKSV